MIQFSSHFDLQELVLLRFTDFWFKSPFRGRRRFSAIDQGSDSVGQEVDLYHEKMCADPFVTP